MIHKLRKKFILINMMLVGAVLLVVFCAVCLSTHHRLREDSLNAMRQAVSYPFDEKFPHLEIGRKERRSKGKPMPMMPVFVVELAGDGSVASVRGKNVTVDPDAVAELVDAAQADGARSGCLPSYGLRYLIAETSDGPQIAFADTGSERQSMLNLLLTSLVVGICALGAFFAISVYLARWALRPVERAWQQQQQFVADASHELKTPLTVILANMGILLSAQDQIGPAEIKWVENTQAEARRMKQLVDDLLFLARADGAKNRLAFSRFSLSDAVWSALLPFEALAFEQGVDLQSEIEPDLWLTGHEGQIRQLTAILIDNACKYAGKRGTVTVTLRRTGEQLLLSVHNTGSQIPADTLPHLFERFYRADPSRARERGGYGLGLAIAQTIVQSHCGRISVESSAAQGGTCFPVQLPQNPPRSGIRETTSGLGR